MGRRQDRPKNQRLLSLPFLGWDRARRTMSIWTSLCLLGSLPAWAVEPVSRSSYQADRIDSSWDSSAGNGFLFAEFEAMQGPAPAFRIPVGNVQRRTYVDPNMRVASHETPAPQPAATLAIPRAHTRTERPAIVNQKFAPVSPPIQSVAGQAESETAVHSASPALETPTLKDVPSVLPAPIQSPKPALEIEESATGAWPTVIYTSSTVTLCVPNDPKARVVAIVLRGISSSVQDREFRAAVANDRAVIRGLESGAYEITHIGADNTPMPTSDQWTRRLIVELEKTPSGESWDIPPELPPRTTATMRTTAAASVSDEEMKQIEKARELVERGGTFSGLRMIETLVLDRLPRRGRPATATSVNFSDLFGGPGELAVDVARGARRAEDLARDLATELGQAPALAMAFYTLARAYEQIETEKRPLFPHCGAMAEICLRTAYELDPTLVGPRRDLAIRLIDAHRFDEALHALHQAVASAPDAEAHFLLGQWHAREGQERQAADAYRRAVRLDPYFLPASFELTRLEVEARSGAIYGDEIRDLAARLRDFTQCELLSHSDRQWAQSQLRRIAWLAREADQNLASYTTRRWIPQHVRWLPSTGARGKAIAVTDATVNEADVENRPIPVAVPERHGVTAASMPHPIPRAFAAHAAPTDMARFAEPASITPTAGTAGANEPVVRAIEARANDGHDAVKKIPVAFPRSRMTEPSVEREGEEVGRSW